MQAILALVSGNSVFITYSKQAVDEKYHHTVINKDNYYLLCINIIELISIAFLFIELLCYVTSITSFYSSNILFYYEHFCSKAKFIYYQ